MDSFQVAYFLEDLPLGTLRYYQSTGSTNTVANGWVVDGAPDLALVVADEQTSGRGRMDRTWYTPPGSALAFSLVLRPGMTHSVNDRESSWNAVRYTALGALAVCQALRTNYGLDAMIKWPNDVLLSGQKTAGILAEAQWEGDFLSAVILGIGVNVKSASVPPEEQVRFPATCVEWVTGHSIERPLLLRQILVELLAWRERMWEADFIQSWEQLLALRGERVEVRSETTTGEGQSHTGILLGLDEAGRLRIKSLTGEAASISFGEI